jgi:cell division protein FtsW
MNENRSFDNFLFFIVYTIIFIGLIMIFSSSYIISFQDYNDSWFHLKKQLVWIGIGSLSLLFFSSYEYFKLQKYSIIFLIFSLSLLILIFFYPSIGVTVKGATRWISLFGIRIQPSELIKFAVIIFIADFLSKRQKEIKIFSKVVLPIFLLLGTILIIIIKQPDLSTAVVVFAVSFLMLFVGNAKTKHIFIPLIFGFIISIIAIITTPYRFNRITGFLNPLENRYTTGYHIVQSLIALGSGGILGKGLGESIQKFNYLPEAHTDYIFSIIGEELGFFGCFMLIFFYFLFLIQGVKIAIKAPDTFSMLLSTGIVFFIIVQVVINIGVVISIFPPTGIPLPFVSYGGSSLVILMSMVGVLLNISKYTKAKK